MTFQRAIENDETWKSDVLETPDTLHGTGLSTPRTHALTRGVLRNVVVECYKEWCGPCKAVVSSFRRISLDLGDAPIKFYTVMRGTWHPTTTTWHCF